MHEITRIDFSRLIPWIIKYLYFYALLNFMVTSRKISLIILSVINLVMFVQIILPHHHHEEEVCFTESHCQDAGMVVDLENETGHSHDHDIPGKEENCTLSSMYLLPDVKGAIGKAEVDKIIRSMLIGILLPEEDHSGTLTPYRLSDQFSPVRICRLLAGKSLALRAPPAIS